MKKMNIFVFDTETTWFVDKKETDLNKQPYIIQFAWILWDVDLNWIFHEKKRIDVMIKPPISIPYNSSKVNNIYDIDVKDKQAIEVIIDDILYYINTPDLIVWHNIDYDTELVKIELSRLGRSYDYKPKQVFCTMNETIDYCKLPKKNENSSWYKRPKLWELHKKLFGEYFVGAHDAMVDVEATLKCFVELYKNWIVKIEKKQNNVMTLF